MLSGDTDLEKSMSNADENSSQKLPLKASMIEVSGDE